jgi:diadenosine tetraphosphatase ApaH/serine/threonine PP2A family protein phosphatase
MKIAVLADIHSNIEALDACLDDAFTRGADSVVALGDFVGYGPDPEAVIDRMTGLGEKLRCAVMGNHDAAVLHGDTGMNDEAFAAIEWTRPRLSSAHRAFLESLPLIIADGDATWTHGSAEEPAGFHYVVDAAEARASIEAAGTPYVFCGHVHDPALYFAGAGGRYMPFLPTPGVTIPVSPHRRWLGIIGSCGQPRDGLTGGWYALFDTDHARLTWYRVQYDAAATARKIRAAGLPERFAMLVEGVY